MLAGIGGMIIVGFLAVGVWKAFPYLLGAVLFIIVLPIQMFKELTTAFNKEAPHYKWRYLIVSTTGLFVLLVGFMLYAEYFLL